MKPDIRKCRLVVIGVSAGGVVALRQLLGALPADFPVPVLVVAHISPVADDGLATLLNSYCQIKVKEADDMETAIAGTVYLAPANYHLLVDSKSTLNLAIEPPVNFARPAIDLLFESAATAFGAEVIGIILTGAGKDGASGLATIKKCNGLTIIQNPLDAHTDSMPKAALQITEPDYLLKLAQIPQLLVRLTRRENG